MIQKLIDEFTLKYKDYNPVITISDDGGLRCKQTIPGDTVAIRDKNRGKFMGEFVELSDAVYKEQRK